MKAYHNTNFRQKLFIGHYIFFLLITPLIPLIGPSNKALGSPAGPTPHEIKEMINLEGGRATVKKLYSDWNRWNSLLRNIASGKSEWLEIAIQLRPGADAGSLDMLDNAVGEALENAPEVVLRIAGEGYSLGDICNGPDIDDARYSSYQEALNAVNRRIKALEQIHNSSLNTKRNSCIQQLRESIPHLQHFFGVK